VGQLEVVRAGGGDVCHLGLDDPVHPERALAFLGAGDEVPGAVLVDQAPGVNPPLGGLASRPRPTGVDETHLEAADHRRL
jgi:hypothetical protein